VSKVAHSDEQVTALAAKVLLAVLAELDELHDTTTRVDGNLTTGQRPRGRPRSPYTGQLQVRVLPEDADWFRQTSDELGIQRGRLMSLLRKSFVKE